MGVKGYVSKHFLTSQYTALLQSFDPELHFISSFACQPQQFGADTAWSPGGWEIRGMICGEMVGDLCRDHCHFFKVYRETYSPHFES